TRLDVEQFDGPPIPLHVRGTPAENPAFNVSGRPSWLVSLPDEAIEHPLFDTHGASTRLRVPSKSMPELLSIGELAARSGVAATGLGYYDDLGLVEPLARASGRRRYDEAAVLQVSTVVFLREIGFSLAEIRTVVAGADQRTWRDVIDRKLDELADLQHRIEVARTALEHGRRCPSGDPGRCPRFQAISEARRRGLSLEESHASVH